MKLDQFQGCFDRDGLLYGLAQGGLTGLFVNLVWLQPTTLLSGLFADYILLQPATARAADVDFRCGQSSLNPSCPAYQATSLSRDSRRGKDFGFRRDFSASSLRECWHLF
jgi:hypothetical protein